MPLSRDPSARRRSLANLRRGVTPPPVGTRRVHGAYAALAPERVDAKVREVANALADDAPVRSADGGLPAHDTVVVRQLAECLCRLDDIGDFLRRRGWQDDNGNPRPVLEVEQRLRGHVLDLLRELGMTPKARAALGLDIVRAVSHQDKLDAHIAATYGDNGNGKPDDAIDATASDNGDASEASDG